MSISVLHIDDSEDDRILLRRFLEKGGFHAEWHTAADGVEAIAYLSGAGSYSDRSRFPLPDLVLLDIKMPLMNGFEVLEWIRNKYADPLLPVCMLSSSGHDADLRKAAALGANDFIVKAVSSEAMAAAAQKLMQYELWRSFRKGMARAIPATSEKHVPPAATHECAC